MMIFFHVIFHIINVIWYDLFAKHATSVCCDKNIIFYSDTAKIFIGFYGLKINKVFIDTFAAPFVNESRYEINTRFVCHDPAFL